MIRNQRKQSSLAVVPGIRMDLNPLAQVNGSAHILRNFIPERGRLIRKGFSPDYTVLSSDTNTGASSASTGASFNFNPSLGLAVWSSASNISASDDAYATVGLSSSVSQGQALRATNFGFSIPTDAIIFGISVSYEGNIFPLTGTFTVSNSAQLVSVGGSIGVARTLLTKFTTGDDQTISVGGNTDTWLASDLTPERINDSSFGVDLFPTGSGSIGSSATLRIDNVTMTVYYGFSPWRIVDYSYFRASAPEKQLIVFRSNGKVYKRQSSYEQEIFPGTTSFSVLNKKPFVGQLSNRLFFSDGTASYVYDGRTVQVWGIARSSTAPTVSAVAAGSLTAATGLKAAITWVVLDEASNRVHESSRTDLSGFQVLSSENLRVDKSALSAPARATHWSAYVSELDNSEILRRAATTAIGTDTVDISSLPAATSPRAPIRNDPPPATTVGTVAKNRIFIRDDGSPNTYFFSGLGEILGGSNGAADESFPGADSSSISDLVNSDFIPEREITNIIEHEDIIFLFGKGRGYGLLGQANLLDNRAARSLVKLQVFTEGCIGQYASVSTPYGLVFMASTRKIYLWDGGRRLLDIGEPIQRLLDDTESTDADSVDMTWYSGNGRQWLVLTLESNYGTADGTNVQATSKRALLYDFSLPSPRADREPDPGTWFEWVDDEYVSAGVFQEETGATVLLLGTETGPLKQSDVIAQPFHVGFTSFPSKMYAASSESNNPAALFRTGLLRPEGDNWVIGRRIDIVTGSQDKIESLSTQPTITSAVDPADPTTAPDITLTLGSALANGDRRAWLIPEASGNTNVGGALAKSFVFQMEYAAGADALSTDNSRNKIATNALYKTAFLWNPASESAQ